MIYFKEISIAEQRYQSAKGR